MTEFTEQELQLIHELIQDRESDLAIEVDQIGRTWKIAERRVVWEVQRKLENVLFRDIEN